MTKESTYMYIGENQISFEKGTFYEAHKEYNEEMGEHYAIKDESGEWYDLGTRT